jgi:hypothetical protein
VADLFRSAHWRRSVLRHNPEFLEFGHDAGVIRVDLRGLLNMGAVMEEAFFAAGDLGKCEMPSAPFGPRGLSAGRREDKAALPVDAECGQIWGWG